MIQDIVNKQREYYLNNNTRDIKKRKEVLKKIKSLLISNTNELFEAFQKDYHKSTFDVISTELGMTISEIDFLLKRIDKYMKPRRVKGNMINFPSKSYIYKEPYGVVLIMSPWNYPLQLSMIPLVDAIACGNTVVLKPSKYSENVSLFLSKLLSEFDERLISVVLGGREANKELLDQHFDYIFFTGGSTVAKVVLEKASVNLTPVSLELGGKSPTIICEDCDIDLAAKRVVWGKYLNAGQTCVAPDYVLCHEKVVDAFLEKAVHWIKTFYYDNNELTNDFPYIINDKHVQRIKGYLEQEKIVCGGNFKERLLEPTIMKNVTFDDNIMQEEIFGPIMPVITYNDLDKLIVNLKRMDKPLALYLFTNNKHNIDKVMNNVSFGGGCINDTIMHLTNDNLPFGGVGRSGMGSYHGMKSFTTFTHEKSIFKKGKMEINVKYPPYTTKKEQMIKKFMNIKG